MPRLGLSRTEDNQNRRGGGEKQEGGVFLSQRVEGKQSPSADVPDSSRCSSTISRLLAALTAPEALAEI